MFIGAYNVQWLKDQRVMLANVGSLVGTSAITSGLGFVYWWLAARLFPPESVGLASTAISAMFLLGNIGVLGLGTLLISELARCRTKPASLISSALLVAGIASTLLGSAFLIISARLFPDSVTFTKSFADFCLFILGVQLTTITLILDKAVIGLLRGELQLWRNFLFSIVKLAALWGAGFWLGGGSALVIYTTWTVGNLVSLIIFTDGVKAVGGSIFQLQWQLIRRLKSAALVHHALNLAITAPGLILPLLVTSQLGAAANASFYIAWMIYGFVFVIPYHFTTVLHAVSINDPDTLAQKVRFTLKISFVIGLLSSIVLIISARLLLSLFGDYYAEEATIGLRILAISVFPTIIKIHYAAISRINNYVGRAAAVLAVGGILELMFAAVGASLGGLAGLSVGIVVANFIEMFITLSTVYKAVVPNRSVRSDS